MSTLDAPNPAVELMKRRFLSLATNEGRQKALKFVPRSTDVFVVTPGKTGTTWLQQIMHQLRSGGDMTFADIDDVIPWIEIAYDLEQDLDEEHKYQPRCFKSHASYENCPKAENTFLSTGSLVQQSTVSLSSYKENISIMEKLRLMSS